MGPWIALALPNSHAGELVYCEQRLIFAATANENKFAIYDRGGGVLPANRLAAVFADKVSCPQTLAVFSIVTMEFHPAVVDVNAVSIC